MVVWFKKLFCKHDWRLIKRRNSKLIFPTIYPRHISEVIIDTVNCIKCNKKDNWIRNPVCDNDSKRSRFKRTKKKDINE